jgi:hypothetical protein
MLSTIEIAWIDLMYLGLGTWDPRGPALKVSIHVSGNASMRAESGERRAESGNLESGELHLRHELRGEMHL